MTRLRNLCHATDDVLHHVRGVPSPGLLKLESLTFNVDIFNSLSTP
jgi:hypothetical protein